MPSFLIMKPCLSKMDSSQYRMKSPFWLNRSEEMLLIPNKSSSARNYDIHLIALEEKTKG